VAKLASAPGGIDVTCTGVPGALKLGTLKLGLLKLGKLKLGKLGSAPQPDRAALLSIEAIVRRIITISQGPIAQDDSQKKGICELNLATRSAQRQAPAHAHR
jgi:hypothetical protein